MSETQELPNNAVDWTCYSDPVVTSKLTWIMDRKVGWEAGFLEAEVVGLATGAIVIVDVGFGFGKAVNTNVCSR